MPVDSAKQRSYLAIHKPASPRKVAVDMLKVGKDGKGPFAHMYGKKKGQ